MTRNYNEYSSLSLAAAQIAKEVVERNSSKNWCGSLEDLGEIKSILKPFNIAYVDDLVGEWKRVNAHGETK